MTCSEIAAPPDRGVVVSTEPTVRCSWLATAAGTAAGTGPPRCGGPGQVPAVSVTWALIPASDASWICLMAVGLPGDGIWSCSVHSALSSWNPTPGHARRSAARICCESAAASRALTGPLIASTRSCGSARKPCAPNGTTAPAKVHSRAASPVASRTVTATQASSNHETRARRSRKDTPSPRIRRPTFPGCC